MRVVRLFLLLLTANVQASEFALDIHLHSKHLGTDDELNETNPGLGAAYGGDNIKFIIGFYKNSFSERTTYIGVEGMSSGLIRVGVAAGVARGYFEMNDDYTSVIINGEPTNSYIYNGVKKSYEDVNILSPIIEFGRNISARMMFIPKTTKTPSVVTMSARIYF